MKIWLLLLAETYGMIMGWGKCPEVPILKDFDVEKFAGTWYEQRRYPVPYQPARSKCGTLKYTVEDEDTIEFYTTAVSPGRMGQWKLSSMTADIKTYNKDEPNRQTIVVPNYSNKYGSRIMNNIMKRMGPNHNVMATDYNNYAVIMNCYSMWMFNIQSGWIVTRDQKMRDSSDFDDVLDIAKNVGWQDNRATQGSHDDCTYDYVEPEKK